MNSAWYTVYEGGELKPGYEIGRIRLVLRGIPFVGAPEYVPIALFFRRDETSPHFRQKAGMSVPYLLSEILRDLLRDQAGQAPGHQGP